MNFFGKYVFVFYLLIGLASTNFAGGIKSPKPQSGVKFTVNKGQWENNVLYRAQLDGGALYLEKNCFTYNFYDKEALRANHVAKETGASTNPSKPIRSHAFRMTFLNSEKITTASAKEETHDYCNFFIGNDKSEWVGNAKNYKEVNYRSIYAGIDMQILGMQNSMKYNFYVSPQGNTADIQLFYEGLSAVSLEKGALRLKTSFNEIVEEKPYAYQWVEGKQVEVPCEFQLKNNTISFNFPRGYDRTTELVIDPVLVFACSSGSLSDNFGMSATYDNIGNLFAGGTSYNIGYPTTLGAYDTGYNGIVVNGRTDVVITKYDSSGTFLQYSTYLGGATGTEIVSSLIVDAQDNLFLYGATGSSDFPTTAGAFDKTFNGGVNLHFFANGTEYTNGTDIYVAKFNSTGSSLLASTFIGGSENDGVNYNNGLVYNSTWGVWEYPYDSLQYNYGDQYRGEIQLDNAGNCYIASSTRSNDFPIVNGFDNTLGGKQDAVVFKLNNDFSQLLWSTYLGGNNNDAGYALFLDNNNQVYVTGGTRSVDFPTTAGAFSKTYNGGKADGYVTKINANGTGIINSTFIGTSSYDQSYFIQLDNNNNVYIVGQSEGSMPVSAGVYSNPNSKQFIWEMDNSLSTQLLTTIFGNGNGRVNISPSAFLIDNCSNIYVCGWGGNVLPGSSPVQNMPLTANALQHTTDGYNFYLFVLSTNAKSLLYATYFGGALSEEHVDGGTSRFDKKGIVYQAVCAGCGGNVFSGNHDDFPVTPGSWPGTGPDVNHNTDNYNCNMGVFKFDFEVAPVHAIANASPNDTICIGSSVSFNNVSSNAFNYLWTFGDGSASSKAVSPNHTFTSAGAFNVRLIAFDSTGCVFSDTTDLIINVVPPPTIDLGNDTLLCQASHILLDAGTTGTIYNWSTGAKTQTISASADTTYWATISNGVCAASDTIQIKKYTQPSLGNDTSLCSGQNIVLKDSVAGAAYLWSTGEVTPSINVSGGGLYWVKTTYGICQTTDTINVNLVSYPVVNLPVTVEECPHATVMLDAGSPADAYLWSNGKTTQTVSIDSGGVYTVKVSNGNCIVLDTCHVIAIPPIAWENTVTLCDLEKYKLDAGVSGATYLWSTGDTTQSIEITKEGIYWVAMNTDACELTDTIVIQGSLGAGIVWFPNSFTPNGNGLNDTFTGVGADITYFDLMVFDRWGEQLFESKDQSQGWNGIYQGKLAEQDVYVWKLKYKTKCGGDAMNSKVGHVVLVR